MLEILEVSGSASIQDAGRRGWRQFGMPRSGPMDWFAFEAANWLVKNPAGAAVIELGLGELTLRARRNCVLAVTGAGYQISNYVWTFPLWNSFFVRAGWVVHIQRTGGGNWAYMAAAGGVTVRSMLGSCSTYARGGLSEPLRAGDEIGIGSPRDDLLKLAARSLPVSKFMPYSQHPLVQVIRGPQVEHFSISAYQTFLNSAYTLSPSFDRMGYRLDGSTVPPLHADLISEGMMMGSVQVPANGQPIVMMADAPTTGGYPKIANVIRASLPLLAQCESGSSRIRFQEVTVDQAQADLHKLQRVFGHDT